MCMKSNGMLGRRKSACTEPEFINVMIMATRGRTEQSRGGVPGAWLYSNPYSNADEYQ